jgi:hypothetical protein
VLTFVTVVYILIALRFSYVIGTVSAIDILPSFFSILGWCERVHLALLPLFGLFYQLQKMDDEC